MRKILMGFSVLLCAMNSYGQEYKIDLKNDASNKIVITASHGNVKVTGHDGNEVKIRGRNIEKEIIPERAKGLKSLYNSAEDNTGLGLSVVKEGNVLKIIKASRHDNDYELEIPRNVSITIEQVNWGNSDLEMSNLNGEIEIKSTSGNIILNTITGPLVANSVSGNLTADFSSVNTGKPSSISLVSGDIDISLPENSKADFKMQSVSGEIYSDLDIVNVNDRAKDDNLRQIGGGYAIKGSTNGGGTELRLNTVSGNIYLRKK